MKTLPPRLPLLLAALIVTTAPALADDDMHGWTSVHFTRTFGDGAPNLDRVQQNPIEMTRWLPSGEDGAYYNPRGTGLIADRNEVGTYPLYSTTISAPTVGTYIRDLAFLANDFATDLAPEIGFFADIATGAAYSLTTPGSGRNLFGGLPGGNAAGMADMYKLVTDMDGGGDHTAFKDGVLTVDQSSVYDKVTVKFTVETAGGDPLAWVRVAPAEGAVVKNRDGQVAMQMNGVSWGELRDDGNHSATITLDIYPSRLPLSDRYPIPVIFAAKETRCPVNCLATTHQLQIRVVRSCQAEGLAQHTPPRDPNNGIPYPFNGTSGCDTCGPFQKLQGVSCANCPLGSIGVLTSLRRSDCAACGGNEVPGFGPSDTGAPACVECPAGQYATNHNSMCLPTFVPVPLPSPRPSLLPLPRPSPQPLPQPTFRPLPRPRPSLRPHA